MQFSFSLTIYPQISVGLLYLRSSYFTGHLYRHSKGVFKTKANKHTRVRSSLEIKKKSTDLRGKAEERQFPFAAAHVYVRDSASGRTQRVDSDSVAHRLVRTTGP